MCRYNRTEQNTRKYKQLADT